MSLHDHIEQVWIVICSRCKTEGLAYAEDHSAAEVEFLNRGWTENEVEGTFFTGVSSEIHVGLVKRTFCPMCNGKDKQV